NSPTLAIHADLNLFTLQVLNPVMTGKLTSLIRVDDLRLPMPGNSLFCDIKAAAGIKSVGYAPANSITAINVYYRCQIEKAPGHRNVCNVNCPHLVRTDYFQIPQKIGSDILRLTKPAQVLLWVNCHQSH